MELLERAEALTADVEAAQARGDRRAVLELLAAAEAAWLEVDAAERALRARVEAAARGRVLQAGGQASTIEPMNAAVSTSIGKGTDTPFARAMHAAGYSLRSLGDAAEISHQMLSMALKGERRLSEDRRKRVEALVGVSFPDGAPLKEK